MPPVLVVVSGLPAAGKTTLSRRLADELGFVMVCRDRLKHPLLDVVAALPADRQGPLLGRATDGLINHILGAVLDAGHGAVVDSNFNWPPQAEAVRAFVRERTPPCFEICLWGETDALRKRFVDRNDPPLTPELALHLDAALARRREPVLEPPTPIVELDVTDPRVIDDAYPGVVAEIRRHLLAGAAV